MMPPILFLAPISAVANNSFGPLAQRSSEQFLLGTETEFHGEPSPSTPPDGGGQ
jgi:hypothetical protein